MSEALSSRQQPTLFHRMRHTPVRDALRRFKPEGPIHLWRPKPSALSLTGYLGRGTIMEFLVMNDALRRMVMQHAGMSELEEQARKEGMRTMYEDGLVKAMQGVTTIEEVLRVTQEG